MAVADVLGLGAHLPAGYRAREFEDGDRDLFVTERNREQHWMEQGSAAEWRYWENLMKDPTLLRVSVEAPDGSIAALADIGVGFMARPDRSQFVGMTVLAPHRRKGIGTTLLEALEAEARRRDVPKVLAGANEGEKFALEWALGHGYRAIGRRIASYVELEKFERRGGSSGGAGSTRRRHRCGRTSRSRRRRRTGRGTASTRRRRATRC